MGFKRTVRISIGTVLLLSCTAFSFFFDQDSPPPPNLSFIRDPSLRKIAFYHLEICGYDNGCHPSLLDNLNSTYGAIYDCGPCDCGGNCSESRTCCPDMYERLEPLPDAGTEKEDLRQCVYVTVPFQNFTSITSLVPKRLISRCPDTVPAESRFARLCRQDYDTLWSAGLQTRFHLDAELASAMFQKFLDKRQEAAVYIENGVPVTDLQNKSNNFKNMFCARCHGLNDTDVKFWSLNISSNSNQYIPIAEAVIQTRKDFLEKFGDFFVNLMHVIHIQFIPPSDVPVSAVECSVNTCNVSGMWQQYDVLIERACHLYNTGFLENTFANYFCALCNELYSFSANLVIYDFPASYVALIDINDLDPDGSVQRPGTAVERGCAQGYMYDLVYDKCRKLLCSQLFVRRNNMCRIAYQSLKDFEYYVEHEYQLLQPQFLTRNNFERMNTSLHEEVTAYLEDIKHKTGYGLTLRQLTITNLIDITYHWEEWTERILVIDNVTVTYVFVYICLKPEKEPQSPIQSVEEVIATIETLSTYSFYTSHLVRKRVPDTYFNSIVENSVEKTSALTEKLSQYENRYVTENSEVNTSSAIKHLPTHEDYNQSPTEHHTFQTVSFVQSSFPVSIFIGPNHTCLKVMFSEEEYMMASMNLAYLPALNVYIPFHLPDPASLNMCLETYLDLIKRHLSRASEVYYVYSTQTIVSLACCGTSALCLLITVAIYCAIKELRTVPGMLITRLCVYLLLSQLIYILTNSIHITNSWLCGGLGLLLHFSTLCYILWMNISTYHMLKAFKSTTRMSSHSYLPWRYVLFVYGLSAVFVLINVGVRMTVTASEDFGYGGDICYINNTLMIAVTFVLPLSYVVFSNTVMFILAIRSVVIADDILLISYRKYIVIFMKLSTLTGTVWVFGLVYQWSQLGLMAYVFIVLNASQGVFILVAFVFNRSIYSIVKKITSSTNITQ